MLARFRPNLTYANVMATIAVFLALGGGAYAAATVGSSQIKKNAILSRHIKNGQVKTSDLAPNSVGGGKIIDGSLGSPDLAANSVDSGKISDGSVGPGDLAANAVGSDKIIDGAVGSTDLAANSVGTGNVADGSLLAQDFKPGETPTSAAYRAVIDLSQAGVEEKTIMKKGPFELFLRCQQTATDNLSVVLLKSNVAANATTSTDAQGGNGFGRVADAISAGGDVVIASMGPSAAFKWLGAAPISALSPDTTLDGVLQLGVNGYHTCEASFFGG